MGTLDSALGLSAANTRQEVAGWLIDNGGEPSVLFHMAGSIHDSGMYWSSGSPAIPLRQLSSNDFDDPASQYSWALETGSIPQPVKESMLAWARKMATQVNAGGGK